MNDFKKRIGRIEARILAGRDDTTDADHCAACTWFADAMRTLNAGGELAQITRLSGMIFSRTGSIQRKPGGNGKLQTAH